MISFPLTPLVGDTHSYEGKQWEWTDLGWKRKIALTGQCLVAYEIDWSPYSEITAVPIEISSYEVTYE